VAHAPAISRARRIWVRVILGIATVLAIFAIFAVWANRQLLNPTNWSNTSTALLQKSTIRSALSGYLVDQLYSNINVPEQIKSGLPPQFKLLAGPIAGGLHTVVEQGGERALESPRVQNLWRSANRAADETLVAIVNGSGRRAQIQGGTVSLNLHQIVSELAQRLGLPASVADKLPASVANLKVVTSSQLGLVRNLAKALHAVALLLTILVVALYVLAVYLARGNRRRTLLWVGWSLVFSGLLVLVARKIGQGQLVSAITKDASIEPAAKDAYSVSTSLIVEVASATIIVGIPVILSAWFAGPARWAVAGRRFLAPHFRERPALAYWITAGLLALVFIWGPIPATRNPFEMLLFTILAFAGTYVLRRDMEKEFPDAQAVSLRAAIGGYARAAGEKLGRGRAAGAAAAGPSGPALAGELERLEALRERGAITAAEYEAAKRELLAVG
jgi:hypothetical protein